MPKLAIPLIKGTRYGKLVAIKPLDKIKNGECLWYCKCDCGIKLEVKGGNLRRGNTRSCGCLRAETKAANAIHNAGHTRLYRTWASIKTRCYNSNSNNYKHYGALGIKLYPKWISDFNAFADYVCSLPNSPSRKFLLSSANGKRGKFSLDRIDNSKSYVPRNLRWATQTMQTRNTKVSIHIGPYTSMGAAAEALDVSYSTIRKWRNLNLTYRQMVNKAQKLRGT